MTVHLPTTAPLWGPFHSFHLGRSASVRHNASYMQLVLRFIVSESQSVVSCNAPLSFCVATTRRVNKPSGDNTVNTEPKNNTPLWHSRVGLEVYSHCEPYFSQTMRKLTSFQGWWCRKLEVRSAVSTPSSIFPGAAGVCAFLYVLVCVFVASSLPPPSLYHINIGHNKQSVSVGLCNTWSSLQPFQSVMTTYVILFSNMKYFILQNPTLLWRERETNTEITIIFCKIIIYFYTHTLYTHTH